MVRITPVAVPAQTFSSALSADKRNNVQPSSPPSAACVGRLPDIDAVGDLATLQHAGDVGPEGVGRPDRTFGVEGAAVRRQIGELRPDAPALERAVGTDVERRVPPPHRLADDQRVTGGGDHTPVRELQVVGRYLGGPIGPDQRERGTP